MTQPQKLSYRKELFRRDNLRSYESIDNALEQFYMSISNANVIQALEEVIDDGRVIELVLAGAGEDVPMKDWILREYPTSADNFENSIAFKLLSKLSDFFVFRSSLNEEEKETSLFYEYHQVIKHACDILLQLSVAANVDEVVPISPADSSRKKKAKSNQWDRKQAKKSQKPWFPFNRDIFTKIKVDIPETPRESSSIMESFLNHLKCILELYLSKIQGPGKFELIKESFILQERPAELRIETETSSLSNDMSPAIPNSESDIQTSFPMVQPMKSALYFDTPEGFGKWRILVSGDAHRALRQYHRGPTKVFNVIVDTIKDLSRGRFSADNNKKLTGKRKEIPIYEAKMTNNLRLVYQIDCVTDYDISVETQVIRLFGIYTHNTMDKNRLWAHVTSQLTQRGPDYRKKCLRRNHVEGDMYEPASFPQLAENPETTTPPIIPELSVEESNELHKILTLEKYVTLSKELLDSIEADCDATFPFEVSAHERTVIEHSTSCYVLGRSGTGKTTTILFKMLTVEKDYLMNRVEHIARPRQVFLTKSEVLAEKVKDLFKTYMTSLAFSKLSPFVNEAYKYEEWATSQCPSKFSDLRDNHFPLFITTSRLYDMLEADIDTNKSFEAHNTIQSPTAVNPTGSTGRLVNFDRFLGTYWPHFNQVLKKNFNPLLVFNEIIGVIQGSERAATSRNGHLDRETYENLSSRIQVTSIDQRSALYTLFETYHRMKAEFRDFDVADRAHHILRALSKQSSTLQRFHYLYVDESQDNLLVESLVLRVLCLNPNGLFWAGDTAQTISSGSSFRFEDLTSLLYRFEKQQRSRGMLGFMPVKPKMFQLAVNYRSHSGIVNCAHAVVELISQYFPRSIDVLPRERGMTEGAKPIFYQDVYPGFMKEGRILSRKKDSNEKIELGAHQCILVRNKAAKEKLKQEIGDIGIIVELYDSKGLEFNDVFLYNFFHDSLVEFSQWRMILHGIDGYTHRTPEFHPVKHAALCSELKALYVAITRARNNLRIADESFKGEPMRGFWTSRNEIRTCHPEDDIPDFAAVSTTEEWAERGKEFLQSESFELARDALTRGNDPILAAYANAHHLRQEAIRTASESTDNKHKSRRQNAFNLAGHAFLDSANNFIGTKRKDSENCYVIAAECFEEACNLLEAAKAYKSATKYMKASICFREVGKFDEVHDLILDYGDTFEDQLQLDSLRDVVRLYHVNRKNFKKAHQLFDTVEEEMEYLEERNLNIAKLDLCLSESRHDEAVDLYLCEGRFQEAFDLLINHSQRDPGSFSKAKKCALQGLWQTISFGISGNSLSRQEFRQATDLLKCVSEMDKSFLDVNDIDEFLMFEAILEENFDMLILLSSRFLNNDNKNAALLCMDRYFSNALPQNLDVRQLAQWLQSFLDYVYLLHNLAFFVDPVTEERLWRLFCIQYDVTQDRFILLPNSLLHRNIVDPRLESGHLVLGASLSKEEFTAVFRRCLQYHLCDRVARENIYCREAPGLDPCLRHILLGDCVQNPCSRPHISADASWAKDWLTTHLLQVIIYESISRIQDKLDLRSNQIFWLRKLHEVLNPLHYTLGTFIQFHDLIPPDLRTRGISVVVEWSRVISSELRYQPQHSFLSILMMTAELVFTFDKKEASQYMYLLPTVSKRLNPPHYYMREQQHSLQEMMVAFNVKGPSSVVMGVLFIRHVMEKRLPIDINVFFSFIERICSSLIITNRYRYDRTLHRVTLPRSWLTKALLEFDPLEAAIQENSPYWILFQLLSRMVESLYFQQDIDYLLLGYNLKPLLRTGSLMRTIFIARLCHMIGLLAYNIRVQNYLQTIFENFVSLKLKENHGFNRLYARFIYAENIHDIVKRTRRSMMGSPLDEMIELLCSKCLRNPIERVHDIVGLRRIVYSKHDDILQLLNGLETSTSEEDIDADDIDEALDQMTMEDGEVNQEDDGNEDFNPETEIPKDIIFTHSDEEIAAAVTLQKQCRDLLNKKTMLEDPGLEGNIYRWFNACLHAQGIQSMDFRYKVRYLCFIPPLLASLDFLKALLSAKRIELGKRLSQGKVAHKDLDDICFTQSRIKLASKEIEEYKKILQPTSDLHRRCVTDELCNYVQKALSLLKDPQLSIELGKSIRSKVEVLEEGLRPVLEFCDRSTAKEERPMLNWDDEWDY